MRSQLNHRNHAFARIVKNIQSRDSQEIVPYARLLNVSIVTVFFFSWLVVRVTPSRLRQNNR